MAKSKRDIHPQFLRGILVESGTNTFTELELSTPVTDLGSGKLLVMNILKVVFFIPDGTLLNGDAIEWAIYDRTQPTMPELNQGGVYVRDGHIVEATTAGAIYYPTFNHEYVLHDGKGSGVLHASSSIFVGVEGVSQAGAITIKVQILYTLVEVSAEEFVGIVRS